MRALWLVLLLASVLAVGTKLFTFEVVLRDDPTVWLMVRGSPALENRRVLDSSAEIPAGAVLLQDENAWPGQSVYRWVVGMGWVVLPLLWLVLWGVIAIQKHARR